MIDFNGEGDPPSKVDGVYFAKIKNPNAAIIYNQGMTSFLYKCKVHYPYPDPNKVSYSVNLHQYKWPTAEDYLTAGMRWVLGTGVGGNSSVPLGLSVTEGKVTGVVTNNDRAYAAQDELGNWSFGLGNPPTDSHVAFGGGIPVIINGHLYGAKESEKVLEASGYSIQNKTSVGKVLIAHNSSCNTMMLVVSPDELAEGGMTLDQIRDRLGDRGYDNIISFDGGSSSTLVSGKDEVIVEPASYKNNTIPTGLRIEGE